MPQGVLPFQYAQEKTSSGMTALAGLPTYLDLAYVAGLSRSIQKHVKLREGKQGWTDAQVITSLILLNLAGGDSVDDLRLLEKDAGFCQVLRQVETYGLPRKELRDLEKRWRKERQRTVPSPSAVFRYLARFHNREAEKQRQPHKAFIPQPNAALQGLGQVNGDMVAFVQKHQPQKVATLDMDATLEETHKEGALYCYEGFKAYQPLTTYWAEQGLVLHSQFRDGNVPAGYEQLRVLKEGLELLPKGVEKVYLRSDTAGYQQELLKYCAQGENQRFGVIEFAIGVDVTPAFKKAVAEVGEEGWHPLERVVGGQRMKTKQEWAEVCFVPNWVGYSKKGPEYRFLAIREPLEEQPPLPGMEKEESVPFPTWEVPQQGRYKLFGVVSNRWAVGGEEVIWWYRQRCGKGEEMHGVMKEDLAGGKLPSGSFGENAAWWGITVLAFNLNEAMKRLVLGKSWVGKRLKGMRFAFIALPGRVVEHARRLYMRLSGDHPSYGVLVEARRRILALAQAPP
jgi:hypothetical protein